ncbi:MAG: phytanoyl-CoA dioxygenase family protein [Bacteroidota bacterium]
MSFGLSSSEVRFYRDCGYLRLRATVPEALLGLAMREVEVYVQSKAGPYRVNSAGDVSRIDDLYHRHEVFGQILRLPQILDPIMSLIGPNVELLRNRHNHATVNGAGDIPYRLHRDIQHWTRSIVAVFVYFEDSNVENGCTHVVPSSQFLPYAGPQSGDGGGNWADEHDMYTFVADQALPVPMKKGGVLLLDSLAFHSVGVNKTQKSRRSMVFAVHSSDNLQRSVDNDRILLTGTRAYKGTDVLEVSGSLARGNTDT